MSCGCSRTGRAKCSTSWSISSPTSSCRPMRSPRAACCCRWRRRCWACGIAVSGALYFADRRMKTADNHFRGFPGLWNVAAFYLFLLHLPPALSSLGVAILIVLTFAPFHVLHPVRVVRLRWLTLSLIGVWARACDLRAGQRFHVSAPVTVGALRDRRLYRGQRRGDPARRDRSTHDRTVDQPGSLGGAVDADGAGDRARHRQRHFPVGHRLAHPAGAGQARAADRAGAGAGVPHPAAQPAGVADRPDASRVHRQRARVFVARHHPDRRRAVPDRQGDPRNSRRGGRRATKRAMPRREPARSSG